MPAEVIDGAAIAASIRAEVARHVKALRGRGVRPGLAVILVGHDPAIQVYVRMKGKACEEAGRAWGAGGKGCTWGMPWGGVWNCDPGTGRPKGGMDTREGSLPGLGCMDCARARRAGPMARVAAKGR